MDAAQKEYKKLSERYLQIECVAEFLLKEETIKELGEKINILRWIFAA
jgi:hypothetical protein